MRAITPSGSDASAMTLRDRSQISLYILCTVLLHLAEASATSLAIFLTLSLEWLCNPFQSDIAWSCTGFQLLILGVVPFLNKVNIKMSSAF